MCFAPQRRALFRHLNFQKWSAPLMVLTFWLRNVLRTTMARTFSTSQLPKVVRSWGVLCILTWKCASRHNGVQFSALIWPAGSAPAALASLLFDPLEPQIIGKTQCFATFLPFRTPASSFFWFFLFSDLLSSTLLFSILLLHLWCFLYVHIVGSLTYSKLPSVMNRSINLGKNMGFPVFPRIFVGHVLTASAPAPPRRDVRAEIHPADLRHPGFSDVPTWHDAGHGIFIWGGTP